MSTQSLTLRGQIGRRLTIDEMDGNLIYLESRSIGTTGPQGPSGGGSASTGDLLFYGQTISATTTDDISIISQHSNLILKKEKEGWVINFGVPNNTDGDIWGSSIALDEDENSYITGGDWSTGKGVILKVDKNGILIWQKSLTEYSFGESIVYKNGQIQKKMK